MFDFERSHSATCDYDTRCWEKNECYIRMCVDTVSEFRHSWDTAEKRDPGGVATVGRWCWWSQSTFSKVCHVHTCICMAHFMRRLKNSYWQWITRNMAMVDTGHPSPPSPRLAICSETLDRIKISGKVAVGVVMDSRKFSWHPHIGRIIVVVIVVVIIIVFKWLRRK